MHFSHPFFLRIWLVLWNFDQAVVVLVCDRWRYRWCRRWGWWSHSPSLLSFNQPSNSTHPFQVPGIWLMMVLRHALKRIPKLITHHSCPLLRPQRRHHFCPLLRPQRPCQGGAPVAWVLPASFWSSRHCHPLRWRNSRILSQYPVDTRGAVSTRRVGKWRNPSLFGELDEKEWLGNMLKLNRWWNSMSFFVDKSANFQMKVWASEWEVERQRMRDLVLWGWFFHFWHDVELDGTVLLVAWSENNCSFFTHISSMVSTLNCGPGGQEQLLSMKSQWWDLSGSFGGTLQSRNVLGHPHLGTYFKVGS